MAADLIQDGWLRIPVPASDPLAELEIVVDGTAHPAFRENDHAVLPARKLGAGTHKIQVRVAGTVIANEVVLVR